MLSDSTGESVGATRSVGNEVVDVFAFIGHLGSIVDPQAKVVDNLDVDLACAQDGLRLASAA